MFKMDAMSKFSIVCTGNTERYMGIYARFLRYSSGLPGNKAHWSGSQRDIFLHMEMSPTMLEIHL
jgi:hypothetical protein